MQTGRRASGYLRVLWNDAREDADHRVRVSRRLKKDFDNGEHYYQLDSSQLWMPNRSEDRPNREFLQWHADTVFRG